MGLARPLRRLWLLAALLAVPLAGAAAEPQTVRVGVLNFGTVNWALDVLRHHGLDERAGVKVEVVPLASNNATHVALQGGAVDVIVTDWMWVSRQRGEGQAYVFAPESAMTGALMVRPDAGIRKVEDLRGKALGVAGGPVDKSWLLLRAYSLKTMGQDVATAAKPTFAAPPLLNQLMQRGDVVAALNYWHYNARLAAAGMTPLISAVELVGALGVERPLPLIGWVFREDWGTQHAAAVKGFLTAAREARARLDRDDAEWTRIRPLLKAENDATATALRNAYREGALACFGEPEVAAAARVYQVLADLGGKDLVGAQRTLSAGTFWKDSGYAPCPK